MRPRVADDRIGYFRHRALRLHAATTAARRACNYINRWRLEKKDPAAALSEPKQPIVFWLDRNIPMRYRDDGRSPACSSGTRRSSASASRTRIQAKIQPDDADFDTLDARHRVDPLDDDGAAGVRRHRSDARSTRAPARSSTPTSASTRCGCATQRYRLADRRANVAPASGRRTRPAAGPRAPLPSCGLIAEDRGFAMDLLSARDAVAPDSPEAEAFVLSDLKETVMHEVGHTLGLTHNFRASTVYTQAQLADREFTRTNGVSGSVMEYTPINIALKGEPQGDYKMTTLGPYDYWAIEYAYRRSRRSRRPRSSRGSRRARASRCSRSRSTRRPTPASTRDASAGDLGADPLAYAARRLALAKELWERWEARPLKPGESYASLRRNVDARHHAGTRERAARRAPHRRHQRAARRGRFRPHADEPGGDGEAARGAEADRDGRLLGGQLPLQAGIPEEPFDRLRRPPRRLRHGIAPGGLDYSLPMQVLAAQRAVLDRLMSESVAQRLLDAEGKVDDPSQALQLAEVYATLRRAIWSDLKARGDIPLIRRNLQREHAVRVSSALLRPTAAMPADAKSLLRTEARVLRADLAAAAGRPGWSPTASAHLAESLAMLDEALRAPVVRQTI